MDELSDGAPIRVLLAEDHGIVRAGVRLLLESEPGGGEEALRHFRRLCDEPGVDVVVTDLGLPGLDGVGVARAVKAHRPGARVLFLTMHQAWSAQPMQPHVLALIVVVYNLVTERSRA